MTLNPSTLSKKKVTNDSKEKFVDLPREANAFCSPDIYMCVSIQKNENLTVPSQLSSEKREALLTKLLEDMEARWHEAPVQILIGKRVCMINVESQEGKTTVYKEVETTVFFLHFASEVTKVKKERFSFIIEDLNIECFFIKSDWKGPDPQKMFLLQYGFTEVFGFENHRLVLQDPYRIINPQGFTSIKKLPKQKKLTLPPKKSMKRDHPLDFENLSKEEKIQKLEAQATELEEIYAKKLDAGEVKKDITERLEKILETYKKERNLKVKRK